MIYLDFETTYGTKYTLQSLTYEEYIKDPRFRVFCVGIRVNDGPVENYFGDDVVPALTKYFYEGNDNALIAHNAMFDGAVLHWHFGLKAKYYICTQAMCRALWNQHSSSLDSLAKLCFPDDPKMRKGKEIVQFKDVWELDEAQKNAMDRYCRQDVYLHSEGFMHMHKFFPGDELKLVHLSIRNFVEPPFYLDVPRMKEYEKALNDERRKALIECGLSKATLSSNDKFAEWILEQGIPFEKVPSPTPKNPDNMKWPLSKDDREFTELRAKHPEHEKVWNARLLWKSPGELRRVERLIKHADLMSGQIAAPLNYCAAHTHRYGGTNKVNFQNFKRGSEIRYSLMAPDGFQVGVRDLSNIEARLLAWLAEETRLLEGYRRRDDIYSDFASIIFKDHVTKETHPTERFVGKTCILGLGYGMGDERLQAQLYGAKLVYNLSQCRTMKMTYRNMYPKVPELWSRADGWIYHMCRQDREPIQYKCLTIGHKWIRLPNGLTLNYPGLKMEYDEAGRQQGYHYWNGKFWTKLYGGKLIENVIQSLARTLMTQAMLRIDDQLLELGGRTVLTVHDEVLCISPDEYASVADEIMDRELCKIPTWCDNTLTLETEGGYARNYSK